MAMWAKSAAGTNMAFIKGFARAVKTWRGIVHQNVFRRVPRTQVHGQRYDVKPESHIHQDALHLKGKISFSSRIVKSLMFGSTRQVLMRDLIRRNLLIPRGNLGRNVPIFSLIVFSLGLDVIKDKSQESLLQMKDTLDHYEWVPETLGTSPQSLADLEINTQSIASGCEGVVYEAKLKSEQESGSSNYDLAVKAVFNYGAESNARSIMRELEREMIPLQSSSTLPDLSGMKPSVRLPPHPNIVEMPGMFVDDVLVTRETLEKFPAAMPQRLDPNQFYGRNKTMYLVMKKRSTHLQKFLKEHPGISMTARCCLLAQMLEGLSHLASHGIAHRDLKSDNLLVDVGSVDAVPRLEICDFGCCLAEEGKSLKTPYPSPDLYLGGNSWLMAPEICTARPGPDSILDFSRSDVWAAGAIAYEILGGQNPFYPDPSNSSQRMKSESYCQEDLPPLPDSVPAPVQLLIRGLLARNPAERPSASMAATVVQMALMSTAKSDQRQTLKSLKTRNGTPRVVHNHLKSGRSSALLTQKDHLFGQILNHCLALYCYLTFKKDAKVQDVELMNSFVFLSRLTYSDFRLALKFF